MCDARFVNIRRFSQKITQIDIRLKSQQKVPFLPLPSATVGRNAYTMSRSVTIVGQATYTLWRQIEKLVFLHVFGVMCTARRAG